MKKINELKSRIWMFLLIFITIILISFVIIPLVLTRILSLENIRAYNLFISSVMQIIVIGGFVKIISRKYSIDLKLQFKKILKRIDLILSLSIFTFVISRLLIDGIRWINIGITDNFNIYTAPNRMSIYIFIISLVFLAVIPAVFEEAFYRVSAYNFLKGYSNVAIILISTLCFSLAHIPAGWDSVISSFILGFVLIRQYVKDYDYTVAVAIHFFFQCYKSVFYI